MSVDSRRSMLEILDEPGVVRVHAHDYDAQGVTPPAKRPSRAARAERALVLARPGDVVLLNDPPDAGFIDYLERLGVGAGHDAVVPLAAEFRAHGLAARDPLAALGTHGAFDQRVASRVAEHLDGAPRPRLTTYYCSAPMASFRAALARRLERPVTTEDGGAEVVALANRKDRMRAEALRLGLPVAPGSTVCDADPERLVAAVIEAAARRCSGAGVIVRAAWSSSGADVTVLRQPFDAGRLEVWLAERPHQRGYLVEEVFEFSSAPNVFCWAHDDGTVSLVALTNQRLLAGGSHYGNVYPWVSDTTSAMAEASLAMTQVLADQGYRGPVGFDLLEGNGPSGAEFRFAEVNGRMNASTYAQTFFEALNHRRAERGLLPKPVWQSRVDQPVSVSGFNELAERLGDLLYAPDSAAGVCPYNTGLIRHGRVDLLTVAGSLEEADDLESRALSRLPT